MMSNVIAFPTPKTVAKPAPIQRNGSATLFIHVKRATLIAHLTGRVASPNLKSGRASK